MSNHIVLIDFENVQPESLQLLASERFRVLVFVGANQSKLPFETVEAMQKLGVRAEYVKIAGNGSNALDFHIAYYLGTLAAVEPSACFYIVSRDTGFDPLIQHLRGKNISAGRVKALCEIPPVKASLSKSADAKSPAEQLQSVVDKLAQFKINKPRTLKTLRSFIASFLRNQLTDEEVAAVVTGLEERRSIFVDGSKVTYAITDDA